jgi:DNA-binding transcriptional ArsR family regulator
LECVTSLVAGEPADLLTIRFAWSPAWETHLAVRTFVDPKTRPYHVAWHAAVAEEAARLDLAPLVAVNPLTGFVPDFLTPPPRVAAPRLRDQLDEIRATPAEQVARELKRCRDTLADAEARRVVDRLLKDPRGSRDLLAERIRMAWERLVAPFWPQVRVLLDADIAHHSRRLADHGLGVMLDGIDPQIRWRNSAVILDDGSSTTVELGGQGLVLMPSAYVWPCVVAIVDKPWQPRIAYPARGIADLWREPAPPPHALARLLGRTRALLLASLDRPTSTTALAGLLGLTPSGVSGHLTVLRDAGLVTAARQGHQVRYSRTPLGKRLVTTGTKIPAERFSPGSIDRS